MPRLSLRRPPAGTTEYGPGAGALRGLSRRVRALILAFVLFVVLFVLALVMPVPYVILSPGPTFNTLGNYGLGKGQPIIAVQGRTTRPTTGNLNLTTVSLTTRPITAFQAVAGWLAHDQVVVPRAAVYPPGVTQSQTDKQNSQEFLGSQDDATAAALCELGYPRGFGVLTVQQNGPSAGRLDAGDRLITLDGRPAASYASLTSLLEARPAGSTVTVVVARQSATSTPQQPQSRTVSVRIRLGAAPKGRRGGLLGITATNGCLAPFRVDLGLGDEIGGPSAGLMFTLGIIDKLGTQNLTNGRFIAGTGTITPQGVVGPIGGIALKMIAARAKGATVFLAPAGNCSDVRGAIPSGLRVVRVSTLSGAISDLTNIEAGRPVPSC